MKEPIKENYSVLQTYGRQTEEDLSSNSKNTSKGIGELRLRIKQNLIGNDHGSFVMAMMPYLVFPTSSIEDQPRYEYGLILPMQLELPAEWTLVFQPEADRLKDK